MKNKACMTLIAEEIQEGNIPLTSDDAEKAWDPNNIYRDIDLANMDAAPPKH